MIPVTSNQTHHTLEVFTEAKEISPISTWFNMNTSKSENFTTIPPVVFDPGCTICYVRAIMVLGSSITIIFVNILAILTILKSSAIQDGTRYFILALAVSDLGMGLTYLGTVHAALYGPWLMGDIYCQISGFFFILFASVSIYLLMLICLDRYIAVAYPLKYMQTMSPRRCKVILATFSIVIFVALLIPFMGVDKYSYSPKEYVCGIDPESSDAIILILVVVLPGVVLIYVFNILTWKVAITQARKIAAEQRIISQISSSSAPNTVSATIGGQINSGMQEVEQSLNTAKKKIMKTFKLVSVVVAAFSISWLPTLILNFLQAFLGEPMPEPGAFLALWLGISNSFANFFIYNFMNRDFKLGVLKLLKCRANAVFPN